LIRFGLLTVAWGVAMAAAAAEEGAGETLEADLLIVGADESGCAAAVQAARLGVKRIVLSNDHEWLGGQFCTQGIGPIDEWTVVEGKRVNFPRSGTFLEIMDRIRAHNRRIYGVATPGNGWCGTDTIEPRAAAGIFEDWLAPHVASGVVRIVRGWDVGSVGTEAGRVVSVTFVPSAFAPGSSGRSLTVRARLTIDSSDLGDVVRRSGAAYLAGPDLKERFGEPGAPETLDALGHQEMNPLSWCPFLREVGQDATIPRPPRYDERSFANWGKAPVWKDWDGSGGIYNPAGWCIYTHRRIIDRHHFGFPAGTEAVVLNWPAHGYPLGTLPRHVVEALEADEPGASRKNLVDMSHAQRRIVYEDAKQRALEFVYYLQTTGHERVGEGGEARSFRFMELADDYGTSDRLPPKPYLREGLRLVALHMLREQEVRTESHEPRWAKSMPEDGVFGWQFNLDFHPTRREFVANDAGQPWIAKHHGSRDWSTDTDRAMFPLRGLVPVEVDGLLGASKNLGVTSMVQSALRLHGQMMHAGTAAGTVAAVALREGVEPRDVAASSRLVREVQTLLVRGAGGPGVLIWPWHDLHPEDGHFEAANLLAVRGIWQADPDSVFFRPGRPMTRAEVAGLLVRLREALPDAPPRPVRSGASRFADVPDDHPARGGIEAMLAWGRFGEQKETFDPDGTMSWGDLDRWMVAMGWEGFVTLRGKVAGNALTRAEGADYVYRLWTVLRP
jgi:hypothetical protein